MEASLVLQAEQRIKSLKYIANQIVECDGLNDMMKLAFSQVEVLMNSAYAGYFVRRRLHQTACTSNQAQAQQQLNNILSSDVVRTAGSNEHEEVSVINHATKTRGLASSEGHLLIVQPSISQNHMMIFYREASAKPFSDSDKEYLEGVLAQIRISYLSLRRLQRSLKYSELSQSLDGKVKDIVYVKPDYPNCWVSFDAEGKVCKRVDATLEEVAHFAGHQLLRVHRGYLVNPNLVTGVASTAASSRLITLKDANGKQASFPVGRQYYNAMKPVFPFL